MVWKIWLRCLIYSRLMCFNKFVLFLNLDKKIEIGFESGKNGICKYLVSINL